MAASSVVIEQRDEAATMTMMLLAGPVDFAPWAQAIQIELRFVCDFLHGLHRARRRRPW